MIYDALEVAKCIIPFGVNSLTLQRILYFVQAEFLVAKGRPCFYQPIIPTSFGVIIPDVHEKYIRNLGITIIPDDDDIPLNISADDKKCIVTMTRNCLRYDSVTLFQFIIRQTPWLEADRVISLDSLYKFFSKKGDKKND